MVTRFVSTLVLLAGLVGCSGPTDPVEVADQLEERYRNQFENVETFVVESEDVAVYHRTVDGEETLTDSTTGLPLYQAIARRLGSESEYLLDPYRFPSVPRLIEGLRSGAHYDSTFTLDGVEVLAYTLANPASVLGPQQGGPGATDSLTSAQFFLDAGTYEVRGLTLTNRLQGYESPLISRVRYSNYRDVDGVPLPFETLVHTEGLAQLFSEEDRIVVGSRLELLRRRAQQMPPAQRAEVLRDVERHQQAMNEGVQEEVFTVMSARINAELPPDVFAPLDRVRASSDSTAATASPDDSTGAVPRAMQ